MSLIKKHCINSCYLSDQFNLDIIDGKLRWFHRNEKRETVFSATTDGVVLQPDVWATIVAMYEMAKGRTTIFVDGQLVKEEISDPMLLSQDWGEFAGLC